MEKLKLPKIKVAPEKKVLSMNDYLRFVEFNLKHAVTTPPTREEKLAAGVNVMFRFK